VVFMDIQKPTYPQALQTQKNFLNS